MVCFGRIDALGLEFFVVVERIGCERVRFVHAQFQLAQFFGGARQRRGARID